MRCDTIDELKIKNSDADLLNFSLASFALVAIIFVAVSSVILSLSDHDRQATKSTRSMQSADAGHVQFNKRCSTMTMRRKSMDYDVHIADSKIPNHSSGF